MNRILRAIIGVLFIGVIMFSAISICQNAGGSLRMDITEEKVYTLSNGTKAILAKLNQPLKLKLYYAKTAARKGPDGIRYYNNYFLFVRSLLEEYARAAKGMADLEVIDPRPYSAQEEDALRYGLKMYPITEEEKFFFGLVVQTEFGVVKTIPFFAPDRQNFIEYDISYLIDTAITRQKRRIGVLSSLPVMGDDATGYMAQMMRMQGQTPKPMWGIIKHLKQQYGVAKVESELEAIPEDVDILLVIHPKNLPEPTQWAIDQFVLKGGRAIICLDNHAVVDMPTQQQRMTGQMTGTSSDLNRLLQTWHLQMPPDTFAGDRALALTWTPANQQPQKVIGAIDLTPGCFNKEHVISTNLNRVRLFYSGVLQEIEQTETDDQQRIELTPLLSTTAEGNTFQAQDYELTMMGPGQLMKKFKDGTSPVNMGYLVTGDFVSSFPEGIEIEEETEKKEGQDDKETEPVKRRLTGLTEGKDCAVAVFADVDFISDMVAYQRTFFGTTAMGDNSTLLLNTLESLTGSGDLIAIRSRGNFQRPFTKVDEIEREAQKETAQEEAKINAEIETYRQELNNIISKAKSKGETLIDAAELKKPQDELEVKIRQAQGRLRKAKNNRLRAIEQLGNRLRNLNMLLAPAIILLIAIVLGLRRSLRRRHYISHASDA